jgi:hypothetical protein
MADFFGVALQIDFYCQEVYFCQRACLYTVKSGHMFHVLLQNMFAITCLQLSVTCVEVDCYMC